MDITVTRAAEDRRAWTLTDLLGRPMGALSQRAGRGSSSSRTSKRPASWPTCRLGRSPPLRRPCPSSRSICMGFATAPLTRGEGRPERRPWLAACAV